MNKIVNNDVKWNNINVEKVLFEGKIIVNKLYFGLCLKIGNKLNKMGSNDFCILLNNVMLCKVFRNMFLIIVFLEMKLFYIFLYWVCMELFL